MAQDFTVDRNSPKWVLGSDGYLKEYANDEPAIEFNADGSYKGVLVEPQSVNEAKASEDLDNATYWTATNTTIAGDTETDPKGGTNSFLLSETVDNGAHFILTALAHRPSIGSGETWTSSIFVKKGDGANAPDIIQLAHQPTTFAAGNYANFDISVGGGTSGTVTASSGGTGRIRYYGNGWYRISFTATSTSAGNAIVYIVFTNDNPTATRAPSYAGQTDANVFVWGAQLEASKIATSYIPTTTEAVTRLKDDIYLSSASSLIGQTEGTLYVEVDWRLVSGTTQQMFMVTDGTYPFTNAVVAVKSVVDDYIDARVYKSGSAVWNEPYVSSLSGIQKIALTYSATGGKMYINGSEVLDDANDLSFSAGTLTNVDFGQRPDKDAQANMWIRAVALFTTRLSDAECEDLTTI